MACAPVDGEQLTERLRMIAIAWRHACGTAIHGAGCSCCGGQPVVLRAEVLAEGVEHALRWRYRHGGEMLRLLDARPLGPDADLIAWLTALADGGDADAVQDMLDAVDSVIASIRNGPGPRR